MPADIWIPDGIYDASASSNLPCPAGQRPDFAGPRITPSAVHGDCGARGNPTQVAGAQAKPEGQLARFSPTLIFLAITDWGELEIEAS